jgi:hypothetical protein
MVHGDTLDMDQWPKQGLPIATAVPYESFLEWRRVVRWDWFSGVVLIATA